MLGRLYEQAPMAVWALGIAAAILVCYAPERRMVRVRVGYAPAPLTDILGLLCQGWRTFRCTPGLPWLLLGYLAVMSAANIAWPLLDPETGRHLLENQWSLAGRFDRWDPSVFRALPTPCGSQYVTFAGAVSLPMSIAALAYLTVALIRRADWLNGGTRGSAWLVVGLLLVGLPQSVLAAFGLALDPVLASEYPRWWPLMVRTAMPLGTGAAQFPLLVVMAWLFVRRHTEGPVFPGVRDAVLRAAPGLALVTIILAAPAYAVLCFGLSVPSGLGPAVQPVEYALLVFWVLLFPIPWELMRNGGRPRAAVAFALRQADAQPLQFLLFAIRYWALLMIPWWLLPTLGPVAAPLLWVVLVAPLLSLVPWVVGVLLMHEAYGHLAAADDGAAADEAAAGEPAPA